MPKRAGEFRPGPLAPQPVLHGPLAELLEWQALAEGAYSPNTLRAQKADGAIFQAFCESRGEPYLPADPMTIRAFIEDRVKVGKKPATIKPVGRPMNLRCSTFRSIRRNISWSQPVKSNRKRKRFRRCGMEPSKLNWPLCHRVLQVREDGDYTELM